MEKIIKIKHLIQNKKIELSINWAIVIFFLIFFSYGFYGVISKLNNFIFTLITLANLCFFYFLIKKQKSNFEDKIEICLYDLVNFFSFFIILLIINFKFLNLSIFGDELAHTLRSSRLSIYGLYTIASEFNLSFLNEYDYKNLVNLINFFLLVFILFTIYLLKWINKFGILLFFLFLTILFRFFLKDLGMHPPLDHIFTFLVISIFGISDFTANFSYLFGFTIFQVYLFNIIYKKFSYSISYFATISIFTIPILLSMSTWTESAIWSSLFLSFILLEIIFSNKINYLRLISIISIGTLFRVSIFITLIPLALFFIHDFFFLKKNQFNLVNIRKNIFIFLPTLLFIPFLINSIIFGTPSFEGITEVTLFEKINEAFQSGIIWVAVFNNIPSWWYYLLPIPFIIKGNKDFSRTILTIYFVICICVYHSIDKSLWGLAKYPSEYALPFCILGFLYFIQILREKKIANTIINLFLIIIIFLNINNFNQINKNNLKQDKIISEYSKIIKKRNKDLNLFNYELVYNLKDLFNFIKKNNLQLNTYLVGTTYGFLPEILNGYKVDEILNVKSIIDYQNELKKGKNLTLVDRVNFDERISAIALLNIENIEEEISLFEQKNWKLSKKFFNKNFGSTIYLLLKN